MSFFTTPLLMMSAFRVGKYSPATACTAWRPITIQRRPRYFARTEDKRRFNMRLQQYPSGFEHP
jgi:hypothetical protein